MKEDKKTVTIIVEGTPHEWPKTEISYAEVVTLEVSDYAQHPEITYSVKYRGVTVISLKESCRLVPL